MHGHTRWGDAKHGRRRMDGAPGGCILTYPPDALDAVGPRHIAGRVAGQGQQCGLRGADDVREKAAGSVNRQEVKEGGACDHVVGVALSTRAEGALRMQSFTCGLGPGGCKLLIGGIKARMTRIVVWFQHGTCGKKHPHLGRGC